MSGQQCGAWHRDAIDSLALLSCSPSRPGPAGQQAAAVTSWKAVAASGFLLPIEASSTRKSPPGL